MPDSVDLTEWFSISAIENAYQKLKVSKTDRYKPHVIKIPMGADGVTWQDFEKDFPQNAANISRRVLNGSYQFYALRQVKVPKDEAKPEGEQRSLAIASIRDALTQIQLYGALYESAERLFSIPKVNNVSFAYRKGRSAPRAAQQIWSSFKRDGYRFAFDADIRGFFDNLNHDRMMALVDGWVGRTTVPGKLLWRYLRTEMVPFEAYPHPKKNRDWRSYFKHHKGPRRPRWEGTPKGVPQGGVLSGMMANLYLHEFDCWVMDSLSQQFDLRYFRYADDFVILARTREDACAVWEPVREKLAELHLELHPVKTSVKCIPEDGLEFLGFHFSEHLVRAKQVNIEKFRLRFMKALRKEKGFRYRRPSWRERLNKAIEFCVNPKVLGPEPEQCEVCGLPRDRRRNWMAFFAATVTDIDQLRQLDRWMRKQICRYFRDNYRVRLGVKHLRLAGMKSLVHEYYRQREAASPNCNGHERPDSAGTSPSP